jgi:alginate O-acetyltransferase complex protein AlgI
MLFNSFPFILLVGVTMALFYLPGLARMQTFTLIAASLFFYAYGQPALVLLLLASILINAVTSYFVLNRSNAFSRRMWAATGVSLNLLVLFFFKYGPLAARTLGLDTAPSGSIGHFLVTLPLPIGISFFTFQGISLLVDVYRQENEGLPQQIKHEDARHHFVNTAFFKAFFPQLVAGPIVKAHDFYPQIKTKYFRQIAWDRTFHALVVGYFLKMVVADNLKDLTFWLTYPYFLQASTLTLLTMLFGYSMQIFADFAGYSLIAIGLARLFGYELMENFNFPYISQSLSEFWRRWHISLSTWLREYLYIPLGGNRKGAGRTAVNLMLVMTLGGLWHGAAWSYALWGVVHGLGLTCERFFLKPPQKHEPLSFSFIRAGLVFAFVTFAWLFFKLPDIHHVAAFMKACATNFYLPDDTHLMAYILFYSVPVIAYHLAYLKRRDATTHVPVLQRSLAYGTCLFAILVNSGSPGAFIYFQF